MIEVSKFIKAVESETKREMPIGGEQHAIIMADSAESLKIVAGPGSGKTTVIVLRILKIIFVDDVNPNEIVATTFTKKAADELKSRILGWGEKIRQFFTKASDISVEIKDKIRRLNFDSVSVGTIDSIAEAALTNNRLPGQAPPIIIDEFISRSAMLKQWFQLYNIEEKTQALNDEYKQIIVTRNEFKTVSEKIKFVLKLRSRIKENRISLEKIESKLPIFSELIHGYDEYLNKKLWMDFPTLEEHFLEFLSNNRFSKYLSKIKFLMVDEYQDTNLLQEEIYFKIGEAAVSNGGSVAIVGDDDQSIYRFRGSRVFLFTDLENRAKRAAINFETKFLSSNYRSTKNIVSFCNDFINLDKKYQEIRVGSKPNMKVMRERHDNYPIFGIFREDINEIAKDIVGIINAYVAGKCSFESSNGSWSFEKDSKGSAADIVLLCSSSAEFSSGGKSRLSNRIREELERNGSKIKVYNPRGMEMRNVRLVRLLCGILIECLDSEIEELNSEELKVPFAIKKVIKDWVYEAKQYIKEAIYEDHKLIDYVDSWKNGTPYPKNGEWDKEEVSILDIIYNILPWIPEINNDAEGLAYLEAICRAVNQSSLINANNSKIKFDKNSHKPSKTSIHALYWSIIVPLAEGIIELDEELMFTMPIEDRLNIMSIHQSKGLEFPITIVDVSSDFKSNSHSQKFKRYPENVDDIAQIEELLKDYSDDFWGDREGNDILFDDLIRKYYVAFSRAQDILILAGLNSSINNKKPIKNIATGWDRDEVWHWKNLENITFMR